MGRLVTEHDARGYAIDYGYDGRSLMTSRTIDDPGFEPFWIAETFTHDGAGRVTFAERDEGNRTTVEYNAWDQVTRQRQTIDGVEKTIDFTRGEMGQRLSMSIPGGESLTYTYDDVGRNIGIQRDGVPLVAYTHAGRFPTSRQSFTTAGQIIRTDWGYNGHREVTSVVTSLEAQPRGEDSGGVLFWFNYNRNIAGHPSSETLWRDGVLTQQIDYAYDTLRRLVTADYASSVPGMEEFEYDVLGNRTRYRDRFTDAGGRGDDGVLYTHNAANGYTTIGGVTIGYDGAGNVTQDEDGYEYTYDFANRIVEVRRSDETVVASYEYDAMGRRTVSVLNGQRVRYYYDDKRNVVAEFDSKDTRLRYYVDGTTFIDEHVVVHDDGAGADYYYAPQDNHTVAGLINANGNVVESYTYDAYGRLTIDGRVLGDGDVDGDVDMADVALFDACFTGTTPEPLSTTCDRFDADYDSDVDLDDFAAFAGCVTGPGVGPMSIECVGQRPMSELNPYFFTGRRLDFVDGGANRLQWNRKRYYSSEHGRWLSRDPVELDDGPNLYQYARSSPGRFVDPQGTVAGTIHTPWGDFGVDVSGGCTAVKWSDSKSNNWYFLAGKLVVGVEGKIEIEGKVCSKCCKKPTPRAGEELIDVSVSGTLEGSISLTFRPWGFHYELDTWLFGTYIVDGWLGVTIQGQIGGKGTGTIGTDRCNNKLLTGSVCVTVFGSVTISGGGELSVTEEGEPDPWFSITAALRGQISAEISNCYKCKGGQCGWSGWKNPCVKGKVWVEFKLLKWGISVDLIDGKIYGGK